VRDAIYECKTTRDLLSHRQYEGDGRVRGPQLTESLSSGTATTRLMSSTGKGKATMVVTTKSLAAEHVEETT